MTPDERARLRELATAATPGPWRAPRGAVYPRFDNGRSETVFPVTTAADSGEEWWDAIWVKRRKPDADYIAATHPQAILALLDELDAALTAVRELVNVGAAMRYDADTLLDAYDTFDYLMNNSPAIAAARAAGEP